MILLVEQPGRRTLRPVREKRDNKLSANPQEVTQFHYVRPDQFPCRDPCLIGWRTSKFQVLMSKNAAFGSAFGDVAKCVPRVLRSTPGRGMRACFRACSELQDFPQSGSFAFQRKDIACSSKTSQAHSLSQFYVIRQTEEGIGVGFKVARLE